MVSVQTWVVNRYKLMKASTGLQSDTFEKSARAYRTVVHPLLRERLQTLTKEGDDISDVTSTQSYTYQTTDQGFKGSTLMNYTFQSFFDQEEPEYEKIIYLKCSTRTMVEGPNGKATSLSTLVQNRLRDVKRGRYEIADFRDYAHSLLSYQVYQDLFERPFAESELYQGVMRFLAQHDYSFPPTAFVSITGRDLPQDLIMKAKFYPARDDLRAYCVDYNLLRHLAGCCLHRLFLPKQMKMREHLDRNSVLPARDKDMINIVIPKRFGRTHRVILADISNFTGSAANAWLMLFSMSLELSKGGTWDKPANVYVSGDQPFMATWRDLIVTYLYLTVGVSCFIPEEKRSFTLPGGYLGVAGNITIGLVYLAIVLQNLKFILRGELDFIECQAGGDDMFIVLTGHHERVERATVLCKEHLQNYVGNLKTFDVYDLENVDPGIMEGIFCKKRIWLNKRERCYELVSEHTLPIHACLLRSGYIQDRREQFKAWNNLHLDLKRFEENLPLFEQQADSIREFFAFVYPSILPMCESRVVRHALQSAFWEEVDGFNITRNARNYLSRCYGFVVNGVVYLETVKERIIFALSAGELLYVTFDWMESKTKVVCRKGELLTRKHTITTMIVTTADKNLVKELIENY